MLRLRRRRFESAFTAPPPTETEPEREARIPTESATPDEPVGNPLLNSDGSPIGLRRYCELVTPAWRWDWRHLVAIDAVLDQVIAGKLKRVILSIPPRVGKTEKATVRFASYALELNPALPILLTGYNDKFARRLSRKTRKLVRGRVRLSMERNSAEDWETEQGGGVRAAGVGVGIAGLPAGLVLIDDPTKSREDAYSLAHRDRVWEWYLEDVYSRLEPDGAIVITMARRHEDDLVGRLLAQEAEERQEAAEDGKTLDDEEKWTVVRLPSLAEADDPLGRAEGEALCPDRYDEKKLKRIQRKMGPAAFSSLHQQRPAPASGLIFKEEWFRYYTTRDHPIIEDGLAFPFLPDKLTDHTQSFDCSFKDKKTSDYVAGLVGARRGANCYILPDHVHDRLDFPKTVKAIRAMTARNPAAATKLVEDKANGPAVISTLRHEIQGLIPIEPEGDKVSRAWAVTHLFEAGNVWFPHPSIAPWVKQLTLELLQFPLAAHDDYTDALTQLLRRFDKRIQAEGKTDQHPPSITQSVG